MQFILNNKKRNYEGDGNTSLLKYLRDVEGIISVKDGCSCQAFCGACMVEADGEPVLSCVTPMRKLENAVITTIEGFPEKLKEMLGRLYAEKGAVQCGFCTPGFLTRTKILLENNTNPTRDEIKKALKFNVCRCTGYVKIIEAIEAAARELRENKKISESELTGKIGTRYPKYKSYETAIGARPFVCDIKLNDMLHSALKFSDHPRAKVLKMDFSEAEKLPGVIKIFTANDIPGQRDVGIIIYDWPLMIMEGEETRYIGDVLAGVVAETEEIARKAMSLIKVQYEELKPLLDPEESENSTVKIHPKGNILDTCVIRRGDDVEKVLNNSEYTASGTFKTQVIEHAFLEPECVVSEYLPDDSLRIYSQSQGVYEDQKQIMSLLNLPAEKVDVILVPNGGGFGGKEDMTVQGHAALFSYLLMKNIRLAITRDESIKMHPKRHALKMEYKIGCDKNGILTGLRTRIIGDTGAYASVGMKVLERAAGHATGAYHIPSVDIISKAIYTNNIPCGAMRGFGVPQVTFAVESLIDELCEKGNFDRWQFRYNNAVIEGKMTATGQILKAGVGVRESLLAVKEDFYKSKYAGIACGIKNTGIGNGMPDFSEVKIEVLENNKVRIHHGWTEMGQGVHTVALQTVCEETGINPLYIEVVVDTKYAAVSGMTTASRGTSLVGNALIEACKEFKKDLINNSLESLAGRTYYGKWICDWTTKPGAPGEVITHYSYSYAAQVVSLDDKGKVDTVIAAHDAGKIINRTLFEGQIEGAVIMGLGYALSEEVVLIDGKPKSTKMKDLGLYKAKDIPNIIVKGIEVNDPNGPFGAKGIGEIGMVPTAAAVANALYQFDKKRRYVLPMKGDK
jgi:aldehyde oxidoreductase